MYLAFQTGGVDAWMDRVLEPGMEWNETIYVDGNMSPDLQCTRLLAKRLVFSGRVYINRKCDGDKTTFEGTEVRLIS